MSWRHAPTVRAGRRGSGLRSPSRTACRARRRSGARRRKRIPHSTVQSDAERDVGPPSEPARAAVEADGRRQRVVAVSPGAWSRLRPQPGHLREIAEKIEATTGLRVQIVEESRRCPRRRAEARRRVEAAAAPARGCCSARRPGRVRGVLDCPPGRPGRLCDTGSDPLARGLGGGRRLARPLPQTPRSPSRSSPSPRSPVNPGQGRLVRRCGRARSPGRRPAQRHLGPAHPPRQRRLPGRNAWQVRRARAATRALEPGDRDGQLPGVRDTP
ncbi:hypothetical protein SALBM311S_01331 [Streptomyces alboniger]